MAEDGNEGTRAIECRSRGHPERRAGDRRGLAFLEAWRDGRVPQPPIRDLTGFRLSEAGAGRVQVKSMLCNGLMATLPKVSVSTF